MEPLIAESVHTVVVEGSHHFPLDSVQPGALAETDTQSVCPWRGTASYVIPNVDAGWARSEPGAS